MNEDDPSKEMWDDLKEEHREHTDEALRSINQN